MSRLFTILTIRIKSYFSQILTRINSKRLEFSVSLFIISTISVGSYFMFLKGARFLEAQGEIGVLFLDRMFYIGWSIILALLILSNIITAFSTLYRSSEVSFLMTMPVSFLETFRLKFGENLLYSSWALLILGFPLTLSYSAIKNLSLFEMSLVLLLGLPPFLVIATAIGLAILLMIVWLSQWIKMRSVFAFVGLSGFLILRLYFALSRQDLPVLGNMASFRAIDRYLLNLSQQPFPFMPSHWFTKLVTSYSKSEPQELLFYWTLLILTAHVLWIGTGVLAKNIYYKTFQIMEGNIGKSSARTSKTSQDYVERFTWLPSPTRGIVMKDTLQFIRSPQQWVQFLLFGFFIGIYLINLAWVDIRVDAMVPFWRTMVFIFNFGFNGYILAALTARFVFPLVSMEGKAIWIVRTAPFSINRLFREKFWMSFIIFFTLAEIVALASNYYLQQSLVVSLISTGFLLMMSISLISLSLGFGAVYAQFSESNPMKISSGTGGIITIVISLFYVAIMVAALVGIIYLKDFSGMGQYILIIFAAVIIFNILFIYFPLKWGRHALMTKEY
jgi:ABC-2 type transport system permease protein